MRFQILITLFSLLSVAVQLSAVNPERRYHNVSTDWCDTLITLSDYAPIISHKAIETRASSATEKKRANPDNVYGVAWAIAPDSYYSATLSSDNFSGRDDIVDLPCITLTVSRHRPNGHVAEIMRKSIDKNLDFFKNENSIAAEIDCKTNRVKIFAGKNELNEVADLEITDADLSLPIGIVSIGKPKFDYAITEWSVDMKTNLQTSWTDEAVDEYMQSARLKNVEGRWKYLDRDNDPRYCRLGGDYTIAIVANDDTPGTFDIIYLDGAKIASSDWCQGMLKGQLKTTAFKDHYDLTWYDASMQLLTDECSASVEPNGVLRLDFPLLKTTIRLSKPSPNR